MGWDRADIIEKVDWVRDRALNGHEACSDDTSSSCFAKLRMKEASALYFPIKGQNEKEI